MSQKQLHFQKPSRQNNSVLTNMGLQPHMLSHGVIYVYTLPLECTELCPIRYRQPIEVGIGTCICCPQVPEEGW